MNDEHFLKEIRSAFMPLSLEYFDTNLALTATNRLKCADPLNCFTVTIDGTKVIFHLPVGQEELRNNWIRSECYLYQC